MSALSKIGTADELANSKIPEYIVPINFFYPLWFERKTGLEAYPHIRATASSCQGISPKPVCARKINSSFSALQSRKKERILPPGGVTFFTNRT